jgi:MFS family permease
VRKYAIDLSPLKKYRDFRLLWSAGLFSYFGSMITFVALPFQIKELTNSYWAVGLIGVVEIIPLTIFGLYGGVLADYVDRKKMIWLTEFGTLIATLVLFLNSLRQEPSVILLFVIAAIFAALSGLKRPSQDAILPRLVSHGDLPSASALMSWTFSWRNNHCELRSRRRISGGLLHIHRIPCIAMESSQRSADWQDHSAFDRGANGGNPICL